MAVLFYFPPLGNPPPAPPPSGAQDEATGFGIKKVVIGGLEYVFQIGGFATKFIVENLGGAIITSTAGAGEEAAIAAFIERENEIRRGLAGMNGGLRQDMAKTDP